MTTQIKENNNGTTNYLDCTLKTFRLLSNYCSYLNDCHAIKILTCGHFFGQNHVLVGPSQNVAGCWNATYFSETPTPSWPPSVY